MDAEVRKQADAMKYKALRTSASNWRSFRAISRSASSASFSFRAMSALTRVTYFHIQNFKDGAGTIENMGIDNVEQIRKNAQIAKANPSGRCRR